MHCGTDPISSFELTQQLFVEYHILILPVQGVICPLQRRVDGSLGKTLTRG